MSDEPITDAELAEWRRLEQAATAGPWNRCPCNSCSSVFTGDGKAYVHIGPSSGPVDPYTRTPNADAAFIAVARTAVPALLSEVERLTAQQERTRLWNNAAEGLLVHLAQSDAEVLAAAEVHRAQDERAEQLLREAGTVIDKAIGYMIGRRVEWESEENTLQASSVQADLDQVFSLWKNIGKFVALPAPTSAVDWIVGKV